MPVAFDTDAGEQWADAADGDTVWINQSVAGIDMYLFTRGFED